MEFLFSIREARIDSRIGKLIPMCFRARLLQIIKKWFLLYISINDFYENLVKNSWSYFKLICYKLNE
jgi:hypothetical protein